MTQDTTAGQILMFNVFTPAPEICRNAGFSPKIVQITNKCIWFWHSAKDLSLLMWSVKKILCKCENETNKVAFQHLQVKCLEIFRRKRPKIRKRERRKIQIDILSSKVSRQPIDYKFETFIFHVSERIFLQDIFRMFSWD